MNFIEIGVLVLKNSKPDLGKEPVGKLLMKLAAPAMVAQIVNMLYNIVDRAYIGNIPGEGSLAITGLGITLPIISLISAFSAFVGMGGAPLSSIAMGAGDQKRAEKILGNSFSILIILSLILTLFFLVFRRPILYAFGASDNTIGFAEDYLVIYVSGTIFVMLTLGMNPFINAQGFAKTGMLTVLIGAVLNIALDPLFIFVFNMGVKGAAIATIISQAVSCIWVMIFLCFGKRTILRVQIKYLKPELALLKQTFSLGLSPFIMQSTNSLVQVVLNTTLLRLGGDMAVGAMTIITSVNQIVFMPLNGLGQGAQPIIGFNFGSHQYDRVRRTYKLLLYSCFSLACAMWLVVMIFPKFVIGIFNHDDMELMDFTVWAIRLNLAGMFMMGIQTACQNSFVALGEAKCSMFLAMLRKVILLIPLVYILSFFWGTLGVFISQTIADVGSATTAWLLYRKRSREILAE